MYMKTSVIQANRKWISRVELKSRELNLALRKTTIRISKFWGEIIKGMSIIILQLMFSIDGDYNNLRNSKIYFVVVKL